jgi:hypothetical protein
MKRKSQASVIRLWAMVKIRGAGGVMHRLLPDYLSILAAKRYPRLPSRFQPGWRHMI